MKLSRKPRFALFISLCLLLQVALVSVAPAAFADTPTNLLTNPGFEDTVEGVPAGWSAMSGWGGNINVQVVPGAAHTGDYGVSIQTSTSNNPWVMQMVPVEEGMIYQFDAWFKMVNYVGGYGAGYKVEFYNGPVISGDTLVEQYSYFAGPDPASFLDGQWHPISYQKQAPAGSKYVVFYLRLYGTGAVYFDDASLTKVQIVMNTNQIYYYSDLTEGLIDVEQLAPADGVLEGKTVDFAVLDSAGHAVFSQTGTAAAARVSASFDPRVMQLQQPYQAAVVLKDAAGQELARKEKTIYRWERPTALPQNGPVLVEGQPFFPVIAYHPAIADYPYLKDIGINTVQGINTTNLDAIQAQLDGAQANGLKLLVTLYNNMKVKENFDLTRSIVTRFKDHPAVLGYMIMDEPSGHGITQQELLDAYKLIRSIDANHPTYMVEGSPAVYRSTGQAADILVTDVYPYNSVYMQPITAVGDGVRKAVADVEDVKPVWTVLQMFRLSPPSPWNYLPTIDEVRNMAYQSFLAGSKGLAYYSINDPGWSLRDSELWPGLVQFKDELSLMGGLVTEGSKIRENISGPVQWGVWQKGSEQYIVAINTTKEEQDATIPFDQAGNEVELLYGEEPAQFDSWDPALAVHLGPQQTFVYRVTPFESLISEAIGK